MPGVAAGPFAGRPIGEPVGFAAVRDVADQRGIDDERAVLAAVRLVVEQVEEPLADQHVLPQRDGSVLVDDHRGVTAHGLDPAAEFFGVAHRRRQADHPHLGGQVQDHLLPDSTAHAVGQKVDLVHHHMRKPMQRGRIRIQHVAQHFGGHDHHRSIGVYRNVAGQQSDAVRAVALDQVGVLLVAQRLDRCGVETLPAGRQRQVYRELADDRLAGPGGRADQHAVTPLERLTRPLLEYVQRERQRGGESDELR